MSMKPVSPLAPGEHAILDNGNLTVRRLQTNTDAYFVYDQETEQAMVLTRDQLGYIIELADLI